VRDLTLARNELLTRTPDTPGVPNQHACNPSVRCECHRSSDCSSAAALAVGTPHTLSASFKFVHLYAKFSLPLKAGFEAVCIIVVQKLMNDGFGPGLPELLLHGWKGLLRKRRVQSFQTQLQEICSIAQIVYCVAF
jgi:hypothetical protein